MGINYSLNKYVTFVSAAICMEINICKGDKTSLAISNQNLKSLTFP